MLTCTAAVPLLPTRPINTAHHYYHSPSRASWWWVPLASKFHTAHIKGLRHYQQIEHRGARVYNHLPWSLRGTKTLQIVTGCQGIYHGVLPPTSGKLRSEQCYWGVRKMRKILIYTSHWGHVEIHHAVSGIYDTMETCLLPQLPNVRIGILLLLHDKWYN